MLPDACFSLLYAWRFMLAACLMARGSWLKVLGSSPRNGRGDPGLGLGPYTGVPDVDQAPRRAGWPGVARVEARWAPMAAQTGANAQTRAKAFPAPWRAASAAPEGHRTVKQAGDQGAHDCCDGKGLQRRLRNHARQARQTRANAPDAAQSRACRARGARKTNLDALCTSSRRQSRGTGSAAYRAPGAPSARSGTLHGTCLL